MAFNPLALLAQQGLIPPIDDGNEILVQAPQSRPEPSRPSFNDAPPREDIDPRYVLNDDRMAPHPDELKEIVPREGMFGVKGTLRDILGVVGDAFLVQSGNKPMYAPQRQRERAGDAMFGASQDPLQAAERLAALGHVEEAQQLIQDYQQNQYQQGVLSSQEGNRQDQARNRTRDDVDRARNKVARWFQSAGENPEAIAFVYQLAQTQSEELGVPIEALIPGPNLTEAQRAVMAGGDMTVNQQQNLPLAERRTATGEKNADSARINATRPRNPPARPRADTDQEAFFEIGNIPEGQRTQAQRDFYKKYTEGTGGNRRSAPPPPPPGGGTASRFRPVR